jgi:Ca-activated chloride channel family protein
VGPVPFPRARRDRSTTRSSRDVGFARVAVVLLLAISASAQEARDPELSILWPEPDEYVSGLTKIRASLTTPEATSQVVFFADGRQLCTLTTAPFECEWDAGRMLTEHQVRVAATLRSGERLVKTVRTKGLEGYAENVNVDVVQVTVSVTDPHGRFIRGLPGTAFHVFDEGRQQPISHFHSENVPLDVVVALDISASMERAMPKLKEAAKAFLGSVPEGDRVTLVGFNDTMFTLTRRATSVADRVKAVDRLTSWGATSLYDVIIRSVEMLGAHTGRKAVVLFTDGEDSGSYATIADVERRLQASDVTLYVIAQGGGLATGPHRMLMERLTAPTGGRAIFTDSVNELQGVFGSLLEELSHQYLLGYVQPDSRRDGRWRRIKVEVDGYTHIRSRQGYRVTQK